jgi:hypothetical protein
MANKGIELKKSNLIIIGKGMDSNGNKVVKLKYPNSRAFSIQTNGNLPITHKALSGAKSYAMIKKVANMDDIENEIIGYIKSHGTKAQKNGLEFKYKYILGADDSIALSGEGHNDTMRFDFTGSKYGMTKSEFEDLERVLTSDVVTAPSISEAYEKVREKNSNKFKKGGRTKAALAKDRKYTSEEPHEQAYKAKRKSKVLKYKEVDKKAKGGEVQELDSDKALQIFVMNKYGLTDSEAEVFAFDFEGEHKYPTTAKKVDRFYDKLNDSYAKGGEIESINPKKFTLYEIDDILGQDVEVSFIVKGIGKPDAIGSDKEVIWKSGDGAKKHKEWFSKNLTISDYGDINASKGSETLYSRIVVYMADDRNDEQPYTVYLYTRDNIKGLKSLVSHFVTKMEKGGSLDVRPHYNVLALEHRHDLQYGDSKRFSSEKEAIEWGEKKFKSEDVGEVQIDRFKPSKDGKIMMDTVYRINDKFPLGERVVMKPVEYAKGGSVAMNNLDWGKSTSERNKNLDHYESLKTVEEKEAFKNKLKSSKGLESGRLSKESIEQQGYTTSYKILGEDIVGKEVTVNFRKEKGIVDGFKDLGKSNYDVLIFYPTLGFSESSNAKESDVRFVEEFKEGGSVKSNKYFAGELSFLNW